MIHLKLPCTKSLNPTFPQRHTLKVTELEKKKILMKVALSNCEENKRHSREVE
jgi:hypothetical protein